MNLVNYRFDALGIFKHNGLGQLELYQAGRDLMLPADCTVIIQKIQRFQILS